MEKYIFAISITTKPNTMNTILNITKGLTAEITIIEGMVFINTNYNGNKRTMSFENISIAINETTMPAIATYLKSI